MVHNVKRVSEVVNSLPGVSCQPVEGGAFAFPRVRLPPKAIQKAEVTTPRTENTTQNQSRCLFYYIHVTDFRVIFGHFRNWE